MHTIPGTNYFNRPLKSLQSFEFTEVVWSRSWGTEFIFGFQPRHVI